MLNVVHQVSYEAAESDEPMPNLSEGERDSPHSDSAPHVSEQDWVWAGWSTAPPLEWGEKGTGKMLTHVSSPLII